MHHVDGLAEALVTGSWRASLGGVLYFPGGHRDGVRAGVVELFEEFVRTHGGELRWRLHPRSTKQYPLDSKRVPGARAFLAGAPRDAAWRLGVRAGADPALATPPLLDVTGGADWYEPQGRAGHLELAFPITSESLSELRVRWAAAALALDATSGHAGVGFVFPPDARHDRDANRLYELAMRHPGLNVCVPAVDVAFVESARIRGADWLTWVGPTLAASMNAPRPAPATSVTVEARGGGLLVQAGAAPELGEPGRPPATYVAAGCWLAPLRARAHTALGRDAPGQFNRAETEAWLARFDGG